MFAFMENIKIGNRIALALVMPVVGMLLFSGLSVFEKRQVMTEMGSLRELAVLGPVISDLVHELQKERGASALFLGSKGTKFGSELAAQRKLTEEKEKLLSDAFGNFDVTAYGQGLQAKISDAQTALQPLAGMRGRIDSQSASVSEMAGYFTPTIGKLLAIIEQMTQLSSEARVTDAINAYTSFLQGKERAGVERAMGSAGFGAGAFAPQIGQKFVELIAQQKTYLDVFNISATEQQRAFRQQTVAGPDVQEVERMRKIAIESPQTGTLRGIEGSVWYDTITNKINLLKEVEDKIARDLVALASQTESKAQSTFILMATVTLVLLLATVSLVVIIVRGITRPLLSMTSNMSHLAAGERQVDIQGSHRGDEIGAMAKAVAVFKESLIQSDRMAEEQRKDQEVKERRRLAMEEMTGTFEKGVDVVLGEVAMASDSMKGTAESMAATAEETSRQATVVSAAAEQASANVQTVASAAEELSGSIHEISRQVVQSTEIAQRAVGDAKQTDEKIQGLADAVLKIGEVVALITDIADQTNLLALNATIEAARAGEAGKGFAVVASEVKNLAGQTAKATEEISAQIGSVQSATQEAVEAIRGIGKTIGEINEITSSIAAAVEEQGAATQEIARNVDEASRGTQEVTSNISGVNQAAGETGQAANQVMEAVGLLTQQSQALTDEIKQFLDGIKAA